MGNSSSHTSCPLRRNRIRPLRFFMDSAAAAKVLKGKSLLPEYEVSSPLEEETYTFGNKCRP